MASSKLVFDVELISDTLATLIWLSFLTRIARFRDSFNRCASASARQIPDLAHWT